MNIQVTSSRKVGMRDINALLSAPISRIKTLRDDEGRRGFTLIELLVVVLIIAILAAIALPQYQKAVAKSSMNNLLLVGRIIHEAQERYYLEHGVYTNQIDNLDITIDKNAFSTLTIGLSAMTLADKRQPALRYVWYNQHAHAKDSGLQGYNNKRICRVYNDSQILKQLCMQATGSAGGDTQYYWGAYFP